MLGEDYDEEYDSNIKDIFTKKTEQNSNHNNNHNDILEFSANKSGEEKKEKHKKKKKKVVCENCKALTQKINELEQLNNELLKIKEKLSQENEELTLKNEELKQNNINIVNQNNELLTLNKKLKEENTNLINKNRELIEDNNKTKKELNVQLNNNKEDLNKKQKENKNINIDNKIEIKNNNISNTEPIIPNKEIVYSKKKDSLNLSKFCSIDDFNKLKSIVEELQTKINNIEQWKKSLQNKPNMHLIEKKEVQKVNLDLYSKEKNIEELKQNNNNININPNNNTKNNKNNNIINNISNINNNSNNNINNNMNNNNDVDKTNTKYIKKNIEDDKVQKIRNKFESINITDSDDSNGYSNARTEQNNYIKKKIKQKSNQKEKTNKKDLSLKVKRIPSKTKESQEKKEISQAFNSNNIDNIFNPKNNITNNNNPYINIPTNNIIRSQKSKPKHKNQRFNSKIITNMEDLDLIARGLAKDDIDSLRNLQVLYKLRYRASEHGGEAEDFHERCDEYEGTLIIIKTKDDNMFGGYTKVSWDDEDGEEKMDEDAFVFSINLEKLYFNYGKRKNIKCNKNKGPCFVGMLDVQEHILKGKGFVNSSGIQCFDGENEKYEINGGKNEFIIEEMEVFQVVVKSN